MKEATGELNMTVVTIVAIAALVAFFYLVIWPVVQSGMTLTSACSTAGGQTYSQTLEDGATVTCTANTAKDGVKSNAKCTYKATNGRTTSRTCS